MSDQGADKQLQEVIEEKDLGVFVTSDLKPSTDVSKPPTFQQSSGLTTDPTDPVMLGGPCATSNAYLCPLLFFSLSTSDAIDEICSRPRLTARMWSVNCGPQPRISWQPCLTALFNFYCQIT